MKRLAALVVALIAGLGAVAVVPQAAHASTCTAASANMRTSARISGSGVLKFVTTVTCGGPASLQVNSYVVRNGDTPFGSDVQGCWCTSVTATVSGAANAGLYRVDSTGLEVNQITFRINQTRHFLVAGGVVVPVPEPVSEFLYLTGL